MKHIYSKITRWLFESLRSFITGRPNYRSRQHVTLAYRLMTRNQLHADADQVTTLCMLELMTFGLQGWNENVLAEWIANSKHPAAHTQALLDLAHQIKFDVITGEDVTIDLVDELDIANQQSGNIFLKGPKVSQP